MKVVQKSDEYTIYQRRDERYAVRDASRNWVNGDDKVAVLVAAGLITVALPAKQEEAPAEEEAAEASAEESAEEAPAEDGEEAGDDS